ncbi:MAG: Bax inhibitor-1/YccA family protein [Paludibacteraceae bacterium]|nr:Bax inhibitor-1/YccA family protein [Paludibacteraceae bacterium]
MATDYFSNDGYSYSLEEATAQRTLMRNVYLWMTLALAVTGIMSYITASTPVLLNLIFGNPAGIWVLIIAELVLVFVLSARIDKLSFAAAGIMFVVYSLLNGLMLSSIFIVYTMESIATTFFVSAGMFGAMALIGTFTKKDLSGIGRFAIMALIGLIIASLVNMFVQSSQLGWIISFIGVILFAALTSYDAQKIKQMLTTYATDVNESTQKIALLGSLSLYLDFINLFLYLLRFLGRRN